MIVLSIVAMLLGAPSADGTVSKTVASRDFAACILRQAEGQTKRFLASEPGSRDEHELGRTLALAHFGCVGPRRVFSTDASALRGALAEVLFEREPSALSNAASMSGATPAHLASGLKEEAFRPAYAMCVARADPTRTAAVLKTDYASAAERQATVAMSATLMACMPTDVAYHLRADELRPYLAAALYYASVRGQAGR